MIPAPRDPITRRLFDALEEEQKQRRSRAHPEWIEMERRRMWHEVCALAGAHIPLSEVEIAERMAVGHIDYAHKFALYCADLVRKAQKQ